MSAWWILPSVVLAGGAALVWWAARLAAAESASLRAELRRWEPVCHDASGLRHDAGGVRARLRELRHR